MRRWSPEQVDDAARDLTRHDDRRDEHTVTTTQVQAPFTVGHRTVTRVAGPLIMVDRDGGRRATASSSRSTLGTGPYGKGKCSSSTASIAVVQVFGGTAGIGRRDTSVLTRGRAARNGVGADYFGRVLDGLGRPRDDGPEPVPDAYRHVNGLPLNPITRAHPESVPRDGCFGNRRPRHARPRTETADLLRRRASRERPRDADRCPRAGSRRRRRGRRHPRRHGHHPT